MALVGALNSHPFLKGGTALNLFHFNVPRVSVGGPGSGDRPGRGGPAARARSTECP